MSRLQKRGEEHYCSLINIHQPLATGQLQQAWPWPDQRAPTRRGTFLDDTCIISWRAGQSTGISSSWYMAQAQANLCFCQATTEDHDRNKIEMRPIDELFKVFKNCKLFNQFSLFSRISLFGPFSLFSPLRYFSFSDISVWMNLQFSDILGLLTFQLKWHFNVSNLSVLTIFYY